MNKEKCISIGVELKQHKNLIKKKMDQIIKQMTITSSRDTVSELVECCLLCEIECQELIDTINGTDSDKQKAIQYTLFGYTQ